MNKGSVFQVISCFTVNLNEKRKKKPPKMIQKIQGVQYLKMILKRSRLVGVRERIGVIFFEFLLICHNLYKPLLFFYLI